MRSSIWAMCILLLCSCGANNTAIKSTYLVIDGQTMGTYYVLKYEGVIDYQREIDSILYEVNDQLSTYIDTSLISLFNTKGPITFSAREGQYLVDNIRIADSIYHVSDGYYDPTVMPLVNYWGFGYEGRNKITQVDTSKVSAMLPLIGYDQIHLTEVSNAYTLTKEREGTELDYSASAKGYGVDAIAKYLKSQGVHNLMVDIGGEQVLYGHNSSGKPWSIGINRPTEDSAYADVALIIASDNIAVASSGNYRNFYEVGGKKYSHTINPKTGFPERSNVLGVTVVAPQCAYADGYATACMVLGLEKGIEMIESIPNVEAAFFYNENEQLAIKMSSNFKKYIKP